MAVSTTCLGLGVCNNLDLAQSLYKWNDVASRCTMSEKCGWNEWYADLSMITNSMEDILTKHNHLMQCTEKMASLQTAYACFFIAHKYRLLRDSIKARMYSQRALCSFFSVNGPIIAEEMHSQSQHTIAHHLLSSTTAMHTYRHAAMTTATAAVVGIGIGVDSGIQPLQSEHTIANVNATAKSNTTTDATNEWLINVTLNAEPNSLCHTIVQTYILAAQIEQSDGRYTEAHSLFEKAFNVATICRSNVDIKNCILFIIENCSYFAPLKAIEWQRQLCLFDAPSPASSASSSTTNLFDAPSTTHSRNDSPLTSPRDLSTNQSSVWVGDNMSQPMRTVADGITATVSDISDPLMNHSAFEYDTAMMRPMMEPMMTSMMEPMMTPAMEPIMTSTMGSVMDPMMSSMGDPLFDRLDVTQQPPTMLPSLTQQPLSTLPLGRQLPHISAAVETQPFIIDRCNITDATTTVTPIVATTMNAEAQPQLQLSSNPKNTKLKNWECEICLRRYSTKSSLRNHKIIHSDAAHKCIVCGKVFSHLHKLRMHANRHLGIKPFQCSQCGVRFSDKCNLTRHFRKHTGERPYHCQYCDIKFADKTALIDHTRRKHTHENPYACESCEKTFVSSSDLKSHQVVHSDDRPFECEICKKTFKRRQDCQKHYTAVHR